MTGDTTHHIYELPLAMVVTRKGQVTIPAPIRKHLGIRQGERVTFQVDGEEVKLKPVHSTLADGYQSIPALKTPLTDQEMEEIVRDETAEAYIRKFG